MDESEAQRGIRDLMSLMALPALWAERGGETVLRLMAEAVEKIVPLQFSYAEGINLPGHPPILQMRVAGEQLKEKQIAIWQNAAISWPNSSITGARVQTVLTPIGEMRVVRFKLGYSTLEGSVWFGSNEPEFPSTTQLAILRAATSLAASGLQAARSQYEREQISRAKDEFLAMLGHELRNPLAPIGAAAELLRFTNLDEHQIKITSQIITRQVDHMANLLNDLLDVSRVTSGLVTINKTPLEVKRVLQAAMEQVRPLIEKRRHRLATFITPKPAAVLGDEKRLVQAVANLLVNAAKFTPEEGNISLHMELTPSHIIIAVKDDGIGIEKSLLSEIFGLFTQAKRSADRSQGGLGLGLALVKNLVELHGGSISAESLGLGAGATFTLQLPLLADNSSVSVDSSSSSITHSANRLRLMVVDDNVDAAQMTGMMLEAVGHEVCIEYDPIKAITLSETTFFDAYLLDIGLPKMNGHELARRLRAIPSATRSVLIAITGYGQEYDRLAALKVGFDHHFVKPVDIGKLTNLLAEISRHQRS